MAKVYVLTCCWQNQNEKCEVYDTYAKAEKALIDHYNKDVDSDTDDSNIDLLKGFAHIYDDSQGTTEYRIYECDVK